MSQSPYLSSPNILDVPEYVVKDVHLNFGSRQSMKAGSPINADGEVANDGTAIGVLLYDVFKSLGAVVGQVVIFGRVNSSVAAEHSGITISDAAKSNMPCVTFTGSTGRGLIPEPTDDDVGKFFGYVDGVLGLHDLPEPGSFEFPASGIRLHSSTEDSEKVFLITVDDDGEITATDETQPEPEPEPEPDP